MLCISCARTVTERSTTLFMTINIQTAGNLDLINNNYFIIFSESSDIALPDTPSSFKPYFPTPGREFETGSFIEDFTVEGITPYYEDYFSTWSEYIVIHKETPYLYQSGSTGFDATTTKNAVYDYRRNFEQECTLSTTSDTISLQFDLSIIEPDLSGTRYFTFATSEITDNTETGSIQDKADQVESIIINKNNISTGVEQSDEDDISSSSDIEKWRIEIL